MLLPPRLPGRHDRRQYLLVVDHDVLACPLERAVGRLRAVPANPSYVGKPHALVFRLLVAQDADGDPDSQRYAERID